MSFTADQFTSLAHRSITRAVRNPANVVSSLVVPLVFLAVAVGGLASAPQLPGFPTSSYLDFALAGAFAQAAILTGMSSGLDLTIDIETGFLNRIALAPVGRWPLLLAHMTGALVVIAVQAVIYLAVALALGVPIASGPAGALVIVGLTVLIGLICNALSALLALRTGASEAVEASFPLFLVALTFSSYLMPRDLIAVSWFRLVATYNPASYLIEAVRSLFITGWDWPALGIGTGFGVACFLPIFAVTARTLTNRLART